jgi:hypothetical protein
MQGGVVMPSSRERLVEVAIICTALMYLGAAFNGVNGVVFTAATNVVVSLVMLSFGYKIAGVYGERTKS